MHMKQMIKPGLLRTPDERFESLPDYSFAPNYFEHAGARLHYLDEGPGRATEVVLCLHGMPTWSFLYRKVVPPLVAAGYRVVCPDFLGAGKVGVECVGHELGITQVYVRN